MYILKIMTEGPCPMLLPVPIAPTFLRKSAAIAWLADNLEAGTEFSYETDMKNDAVDIMAFNDRTCTMVQYAVEPN